MTRFARCHFFWALLATSIAGSTFGATFDQQLFPAFPGAQGAGAYARGGRAGKVLFVTTLADYQSGREKPIPGSLRAAIETPGPRIILFRVAGYIELKSDLTILHGQLTIAGQSAPDDGVCLKNASLKVAAPDVIIRYLRVRPGDVQQRELDCISCRAHNVILDHCSASWGIDETISTNGDSADVTVQWCLIAESLNRSVHHKGSHGYGSLISGPGAITYHHNVYAFHRSRSPRGGDVLLDFRNNLIYGWGDRAGYSGDDRLSMNYVGNWLEPLAYSKLKDKAFSPGGLGQKIFIDGNFFRGSPAATANNWLLIKTVDRGRPQETEHNVRAAHAFPTSTVVTDQAEVARDRILKEGGASLPARDQVDQRLMADIRSGRGRLIDSQNDVGGWPPLNLGEPPADRDSDGMPDNWEQKLGLDPSTANPSSQDTDRDGYPDVEEFLNGADPIKPEAWIFPPTLVSRAGDAFIEPTTITLASATPGTLIRYTLDDSLPTPMSQLYSEPFKLDRTATVRAVSFLGDEASHVRNATLRRLKLHEAKLANNTEPGIRFEYWEGAEDQALADVFKAPPTKSGASPTINLETRRREENFGFRFSGLWKAPADGIYTFFLRCSPRGQLAVENELVVESQGAKREHSGKVALKAGAHPIDFSIYYGSPVDKVLVIEVAGPGFERRAIAGSELSHAKQ